MAKPKRKDRSSAYGDIRLTSSPSVSSELNPRVVPRVEPPLDAMRALSQSLGQFFKTGLSALDTAARAETLVRKQEIEQENDRQAMAGARKGLTGEPLTPEEAGDLDYLRAWEAARAERDAEKLYNDWLTGVRQQALAGESDLQAMTDEWLAGELRGVAAMGDNYTARLLAGFKKRVGPELKAFMENSVKATLDRGRQMKFAEIVANADTYGPSDIPRLIQSARALMPDEPQKAPAWVMNALLTAANDNPQKARRILNLLSKPGTGTGEDVSFAQSFPDAFETLELKLVENDNRITSLRARDAWDTAEQAVEQAIMEGDPATLMSLMTTGLPSIYDRLGGHAKYASLRSKIANALQDIGAVEVMYNRIAHDVQNVDPSDIRKHQWGFITKRLQLDPYANPVEVATEVSRQGIVSDDIKAHMSREMLTTSDPERFGNGLLFWSTLAQQKGLDFATSNLDTSARGVFRLAYGYLQGGRAPTDIAEILHGRLETARTARERTLSEITGQPAQKAKTTFANHIRKKLEAKLDFDGWFDGTLTPDATLLDHFEELTKFEMTRRNADSWEDVAGDVVDMFSDRVEVLPQESGYVATLRQLPTRAIARDAEGFPVLAPDTGRPLHDTVPHLGRIVFNEFGNPENTLKTAEEDLAAFREAAPEVLGDRVAFVNQHPWQSEGIYLLTTDGQLDGFAVGATYTLNAPLDIGVAGVPGGVEGRRAKGGRVTIPADPVAAFELLQPVLGEGFYLIPAPNPDEPAKYLLGYRPRFKERRKSAAEMALEFKRNMETVLSRDLSPDAKGALTGALAPYQALRSLRPQSRAVPSDDRGALAAMFNQWKAYRPDRWMTFGPKIKE